MLRAETLQPDKVVRYLVGDGTVLCAIVTTLGKVVIVANERYPDAVAHAERHITRGIEDVLICSPDCPG